MTNRYADLAEPYVKNLPFVGLSKPEELVVRGVNLALDTNYTKAF